MQIKPANIDLTEGMLMRGAASKKTKILWIVIPLIAAFLFLPVISTDDSADANVAAANDESTGSLPVIMSENPLTKYLKKLGKFYGVKGFSKTKPRGGSAADGNADYSSVSDGDLYASASRSAAANDIASGAFESAETSGAYRMVNGVEVKPDASGYTYNGQYYENGTYPDPALKRKIESSIAKYHARAAAKQGKSPAYVINDDGRMIVEYLPQNIIDGYVNGTGSTDVSSGTSSVGGVPAGRYRGATVASKGSSGSSNGYSGRNLEGNGDAGIMGGIDSKYNDVSVRLASVNNIDGSQNKQPATPEKPAPGDKGDISKNLDSMRPFPARVFREPSVNDPLPKYDAEKFRNGSILLDDPMLRFLRNVGIERNDLPGDRTFTFTEAKDKQQQLRDENGNLKPMKVFPVMSIDEVKKSMHQLVHTGDTPVFINYPRVPYVDVAKLKAGTETFEEVFFRRTAMSSLLDEMEVGNTKEGEKKVNAIRDQYLALDARREKTKEHVTEMLKKDPHLKKVIPTVTFVLGRNAETGQIMVASPKSYLYMLAPMPPDWVTKEYERNNTAYIPVNSFNVISNLSKNGEIIVVTGDADERAMKAAGANTVVKINTRNLASVTPSDLRTNMDTLTQGFIQEFSRTATVEEKKEFEAMAEKKKAIADAVKKGVKETDPNVKKGVKTNTYAGPMARPDPDAAKDPGPGFGGKIGGIWYNKGKPNTQKS